MRAVVLTSLDKKEKGKKMLAWLRQQDAIYYSSGENEKVSDDRYDENKAKFKKLFPNHPYLKEVGAEVTGKKVILPINMGGLNQIAADKVNAWKNKFKKYNTIDSAFFYVLPKLDGISILLHYKGGKLVAAYTRGRKKPGEKLGSGKPVMEHVKCIQGVPLTIKTKREVFIRGEAICHNKTFEEIKGREFEGSPKGGYKHARPFVSGLFNRDTLGATHKKLLKKVYLISFSVIVKGSNISKAKQLSFIYKNGFRSITYPNSVNKEVYLFEKKWGLEKSLTPYPNNGPCPCIFSFGDKVTADWLMSILDQYRKTIDIHQDGIVIEMNAKEVRDDYGDDGNFPEYAVKVKPERANQVSAIGIVSKLEWEFTSRRIYTPCAVLKEPVDIEGISVSRIYLHNAANVKKLGLYIGCKVKCVRAGSVIPHIEEVVE